jgi:hypothetical protein
LRALRREPLAERLHPSEVPVHARPVPAAEPPKPLRGGAIGTLSTRSWHRHVTRSSVRSNVGVGRGAPAKFRCLRGSRWWRHGGRAAAASAYSQWPKWARSEIERVRSAAVRIEAAWQA